MISIRCNSRVKSLRNKNKRESHEKVCENKDFCNIAMPS